MTFAPEVFNPTSTERFFFCFMIVVVYLGNGSFHPESFIFIFFLNVNFWIDTELLRPFLMQSDSASRKRPFSTGLYFDWILLVLLLIVSQVFFVVFVLFLEAVGVREYCCTYSSRNRLAALCFALSPRATARRTLVPASWWLWAKPKAAKATLVELYSAESRQSYSSRSRCWQHGIVTARCCRRVIHAAGMRHADLLREATAGIAKPASAPCMIILQCGTWYGCVAVWVCVWWWDERCDRFKKHV